MFIWIKINVFKLKIVWIKYIIHSIFNFSGHFLENVDVLVFLPSLKFCLKLSFHISFVT